MDESQVYYAKWKKTQKTAYVLWYLHEILEKETIRTEIRSVVARGHEKQEDIDWKGAWAKYYGKGDENILCHDCGGDTWVIHLSKLTELYT